MNEPKILGWDWGLRPAVVRPTYGQIAAMMELLHEATRAATEAVVRWQMHPEALAALRAWKRRRTKSWRTHVRRLKAAQQR